MYKILTVNILSTFATWTHFIELKFVNSVKNSAILKNMLQIRLCTNHVNAIGAPCSQWKNELPEPVLKKISLLWHAAPQTFLYLTEDRGRRRSKSLNRNIFFTVFCHVLEISNRCALSQSDNYNTLEFSFLNLLCKIIKAFIMWWWH